MSPGVAAWHLPLPPLQVMPMPGPAAATVHTLHHHAVPPSTTAHAAVIAIFLVMLAVLAALVLVLVLVLACMMVATAPAHARAHLRRGETESSGLARETGRGREGGTKGGRGSVRGKRVWRGETMAGGSEGVSTFPTSRQTRACLLRGCDQTL